MRRNAPFEKGLGQHNNKKKSEEFWGGLEFSNRFGSSHKELELTRTTGAGHTMDNGRRSTPHARPPEGDLEK